MTIGNNVIQHISTRFHHEVMLHLPCILVLSASFSPWILLMCLLLVTHFLITHDAPDRGGRSFRALAELKLPRF